MQHLLRKAYDSKIPIAILCIQLYLFSNTIHKSLVQTILCLEAPRYSELLEFHSNGIGHFLKFPIQRQNVKPYTLAGKSSYETDFADFDGPGIHLESGQERERITYECPQSGCDELREACADLLSSFDTTIAKNCEVGHLTYHR